MGTITGMGDMDPVRWPNSQWRSVKVKLSKSYSLFIIYHFHMTVHELVFFRLHNQLNPCIIAGTYTVTKAVGNNLDFIYVG